MEMHRRSCCTLHWGGTVTTKVSQFTAWKRQMNFRLFSVLLGVNIAACRDLRSDETGLVPATDLFTCDRCWKTKAESLRVLPHSSTQSLPNSRRRADQARLLYPLYMLWRGREALFSGWFCTVTEAWSFHWPQNRRDKAKTAL